MKKLLIFVCLAITQVQAFEYEVQFENDAVCVAKVVIEPKEEIGWHRDAVPQIVIGLKGGIITRLESDGREVDIVFPTGKAVYRAVDPEEELHKSMNKSDAKIELMIVQIKQD